MLTRGYRRADSERETIVGPGEMMRPLVGGDEAQLLLREFRRREISIPLGIDADRYRTARRIEAAHEPDLFVLDDGFQHFRLDRDFDLVLIDAGDPFGDGDMVPLGRLREPLSGLARASAFLLTRTRAGGDYSNVEEALQEWNPAAPIYRAGVETTVVRDVTGRTELPLAGLAGRRVFAFCGLGNPLDFFFLVRDLGVTLTRDCSFADHHRYTRADVEWILQGARNDEAQLVLTTEKDLVNLCHAADKTIVEQEGIEAAAARLFGATPLAWLGIEMKVENGDELVGRIVEAVRRRESS